MPTEFKHQRVDFGGSRRHNIANVAINPEVSAAPGTGAVKMRLPCINHLIRCMPESQRCIIRQSSTRGVSKSAHCLASEIGGFPPQFVFKLPLRQGPESAISGGFFVLETHIRYPAMFVRPGPPPDSLPAGDYPTRTRVRTMVGRRNRVSAFSTSYLYGRYRAGTKIPLNRPQNRT